MQHSVAALRATIAQLNSSGCYQSALTLGGFLISATRYGHGGGGSSVSGNDPFAWTGGEFSHLPGALQQPHAAAAAAASAALPAVASSAATVPMVPATPVAAAAAAGKPPLPLVTPAAPSRTGSAAAGANSTATTAGRGAGDGKGEREREHKLFAPAGTPTGVLVFTPGPSASASSASSGAATAQRGTGSSGSSSSGSNSSGSSSSSSATDNDAHNDFALLGDACAGLREWRRAIAHYDAARHELLQTRTRVRQQQQRQPPQLALSAEPLLAALERAECERQLKAAECWTALHDARAACAALELVPERARSVACHLRLAELYAGPCGPKPDLAAACYRRVLALQPMAVEASLALIRLGATAASVAPPALMSAAAAAAQSSASGTTAAPFVGAVLHTYELLHTGVSPKLVADAAKGVTADQPSQQPPAHRQQPPRAAVAACHELLSAFPRNGWAATQLALAHTHLKEPAEACSAFEVAAAADENALDSADEWAYALAARGQAQALSALTHRVLRVSEQRPEPWVCAAVYADATAQFDLAVKYADRALALNPRHGLAHVVRGGALLHAGQLEPALSAFGSAHALDPYDLRAMAVLVDGYMASPEPLFPLALRLARTALALMPRHPRALTLIGSVLATNKREGQQKALKAFTKALALDPFCTDAVMALAKLHHTQAQPPPNAPVTAAMQAAAQAGTKQAVAVLSTFLRDAAAQRLTTAQLSGSSSGGGNPPAAAPYYTGASLDLLHAKLAQYHVELGDVQNALTHFHTALALNPQCNAALLGQERLDAALKAQQQAMAGADANNSAASAGAAADNSDGSLMADADGAAAGGAADMVADDE